MPTMNAYPRQLASLFVLLVWLDQAKCSTGAETRRAEFEGRALVFRPVPGGDTGDVLVFPKVATDLKTSRDEFFRIMTNPELFQ